MIPRDICQRVLQRAAATGADYAELFAENTSNHMISMIDSKVEGIKDTIVAGAAVRVFKGLRSVMATTVDTSEAGLLRCAEKAAEALEIGTFSSPTTSDWMRITCDAIKMGPGESSRSHKKDEFVFVEEIRKGIETYIEFIKSL